ncbi:MAG: right-handed parallel beta-helix repeat-containing protein [Polyangiaceae bacterium]
MQLRPFGIRGAMMFLGLAVSAGCSSTPQPNGEGGGGGGSTDGGSGGQGPSLTSSCATALFVDAIAESAWVNLDVAPAEGTAGIRQALETANAEHPSEPVRIRLAPGTYADNLGGEIYAQHIQRTETTPLWIVATDPTPNATTVGHGFNLVGISYVAIEGITVGPAVVGAWNGSSHADPQPLYTQAGVHVAGAAIAGGTSATLPNGQLDTSVYGRYEPSHHVIVRHMTIQNLFPTEDESGEKALSIDNDGMKFNQVENLWVIDNTVTQTSRHGIDNVGVHSAAFCGNVITRNGNGLGIEAKGGSYDVVFESNVFYRVRRVALGGEATDATYYFSVDGAYDYEGRAIVARNNVIIDARESALQFGGCAGCAALDNTILFTPDYVPPLTESGDANGGDGIRITDSAVLSSDEGAGSDCVSWDETAQDYVYTEVCWGVGSNAPAPVGRAMMSRDNRSINNAFVSMSGIWSNDFGSTNPSPSTVPCPMVGYTAAPELFAEANYNYWFNNGKPLPDCGPAPEGTSSLFPSTDAPQFTNLSVSDVEGLRVFGQAVAAGLVPAEASPLVGRGVANPPGSVPTDLAGAARPSAWTIGALEP